MQIVRESPEHHLLTYLEKIKSQPQGWVSVCAHFSGKINHETLISKPKSIKSFFETLHKESEQTLSAASEMLKDVKDCVVYHFKDGDVFVLARPSSPKEQALLKDVHEKLKKVAAPVPCSFKALAGDMYNVQKMVDSRLLAGRCYEAYIAMSDCNKCSTIGIRRKRREEPSVLIVEDDQFTGTYAMNIINKETESTLVKSGEDAIIDYIEQAPDIVFLDIHLPGLTGLKTLDAIMHIDPEAHVIMLSVDAVKTSIMEAYQKGASGFLKKPFSKERLLITVGKSPYIRKPLMAGNISTVDPEHTTIN